MTYRAFILKHILMQYPRLALNSGSLPEFCYLSAVIISLLFLMWIIFAVLLDLYMA